jgi:hypothetical protein
LLVGERIGRSILSWCEQHKETASELSSKLNYVKDFITQLYDALAPQDDFSNKQRYAFWRHVDIANVIQQGKRAYREHFLDRQSLKNLADLYLARPWMHSAYLDWIFTDALIAGELVATYEWLQRQRGGFAYALFEGNKVKTALFKIVQVPLSHFFLGGWHQVSFVGGCTLLPKDVDNHWCCLLRPQHWLACRSALPPRALSASRRQVIATEGVGT